MQKNIWAQTTKPQTTQGKMPWGGVAWQFALLLLELKRTVLLALCDPRCDVGFTNVLQPYIPRAFCALTFVTLATSPKSSCQRKSFVSV